MEIRYGDGKISFEKELTLLDKLAIDFSGVLQKEGIKHVFVAGYISILFGRSRVSEDIDLIVERLSKDEFLSLWEALDDYYCHNTTDPVEAYERYLEHRIAIRFSKDEHVIPNIEFKFAHTDQHKEVLNNIITVELNRDLLPIAFIESQIAYKLYMGSQKDIEDSKYLYEIFKEKLDMNILKEQLKKLNVPRSKYEYIPEV